MSPASPLRILEMRNSARQSGIKFHYLHPARLPVAALRKIIKLILSQHGKSLVAVNYVFCSDDYLLAVNREYLKHDFYTDIITFDLSDTPKAVRADVFISIERVRENAQKLDLPIYKELIRVVLHGVLHLVGYNDKTKAEKKRIRHQEDLYLSKVLQIVPRETKAKKKFHVEHRK